MRRLAELLDDVGQTGDAAYWRDQHMQRAKATRMRLPGESKAFNEEVARVLESHGLSDVAATVRRGERWPIDRPLLEGRDDITALRSGAIAGDLRAMERLAKLLDEAGQPAEAMDWLTRAADAGQDTAAWNLAQILHRTGRVEEALTTIQRAAGYWSDSLIAFELVIPWLRKVGGQSSLQSFLTAAGNAGNSWATAYLARELARNGQTAEAILRLRPSAEKENLAAMELLGLFLDQVGQVTEASAWYRRVDQTASPFMLFALASILEKGGWPDRALIRYRNAIECKKTDAMNPLAQLLVRMGRTDEAKRLKTFGIEPGGPTAQPWRVPASEPIAVAMHAE
jgi:tetratricopeptide (TPR) repeat protein